MFPKNLDFGERFKRITIGTAIGSLVFVGPETPVALIALYPIITALVGSCPLYWWLEQNETMLLDDVRRDEVAAPTQLRADTGAPVVTKHAA